ncbi:CinA family protein [Nocardioides sp. LHG3406-4]|uniref:CinA family protein n=1 Tax=Nocardioides sp. LHG3406-4 TaxID=2804575 RepID=UPI003CEFEC6E
MPEAANVLDLLRGRGQTLAVAESLTGGRLAAALTAVPGASAVFLGAVVAYATALKIDVVGVPVALVEEYGVVSAECARAMAVGVRDLTGSSYALSTTGVAGPDPQDGRPVGTVFVGIAGPEGVVAHALSLTGDRLGIAEATVRRALTILADSLEAVER